jgi:outer membrane lipoprotein carrier protein
MKRLLILAVMFLLSMGSTMAATNEPKSGADSLRQFFREVNSFSARFKQIVLDESLKPVQESSGTLWIERPNKFRWDYDKPYKQQIVADGKRLWVYDVASTGHRARPPAAHRYSGDAACRQGTAGRQFPIQSLDAQDKLTWVQLKPGTRTAGMTTSASVLRRQAARYRDGRRLRVYHARDARVATRERPHRVGSFQLQTA